jgi:hypothetical protein
MPEPEPAGAGRGHRRIAPPGPRGRVGASSTGPFGARPRLPARSAPRSRSPGAGPVQVAGPSTWTGMTDTATVVPAMSALRRDLVLEQAWPAARASRPVVLVLTVERPRRPSDGAGGGRPHDASDVGARRAAPRRQGSLVPDGARRAVRGSFAGWTAARPATWRRRIDPPSAAMVAGDR